MAERRPTALFYDAECGFCRTSAGLVLAWDRRRRLTPIALQDPAAPEWLAGLSEEERLESWHLVTPDGVRHSAGEALVPLFKALPRGGRLASLARRSPAATERVYRLAAEHRDHLAKLVPGRLRRSAEEILRQRSGEPGVEGPERDGLGSVTTANATKEHENDGDEQPQ